jgi:D-amino-acid dehydrogenase
MTQTIVLGAGMVGVSTALALQERGDEVLLVDRNGVGRETSYGNAGAIQTEAVEPYAFPRSLSKLLSVALKRSPEVNWHLSAMPEHLRPLLSYWRNSSPAGHARATESYRQIVGEADKWHAPLIEAASAEHLIEYGGYRWVFRSGAAFDAACREAERIEHAHGVPFWAETGEELAEAEPGLLRQMAGALHYTAVWTCRSPGELTAAYGRLFEGRGGKFVHGDAQSLKQDGSGWSVVTRDGAQSAQRVVLALGPWSTRLTEQLGYRIPMFRKRGYHRHFPAEEGPLRSMLDVERGVFLARMAQGLRLTTGAEFTQMDAAVDWRQIDLAEATSRELFRLGKPVEATPWFGHRPCLPDMLPVLGEAPRHRGLWFHFGHAHQGFTAGPASAHILAELMSGNPLPVTRALTPARFS